MLSKASLEIFQMLEMYINSFVISRRITLIIIQLRYTLLPMATI